MLSSSVTPLTEYQVLTECGRNFAWSARDLDSLERSLSSKGYRAKRVQTVAEYEDEQERLRKLELLRQVEAVRSVRKSRDRRQGA